MAKQPTNKAMPLLMIISTCFQAVICPHGFFDDVDVVEGRLLVDLQLAFLDRVVYRQMDRASLHHKGQAVLQITTQAHKGKYVGSLVRDNNVPDR